MRSFRASFQRHNMELQFWGYECGNVAATIAGAGGFVLFREHLASVFGDGSISLPTRIVVLSEHYPDALVTLALGAVVLFAPALRALGRARSIAMLNTVDIIVTLFALFILAFAFFKDTSWITTAAASFVVGSSFLRQCGFNPFLLKLGGLFLALGGLGLAMFGFEQCSSDPLTWMASDILMYPVTAFTGVAVICAALLTYQGGVFETADYLSKGHRIQANHGFFDRLLDPAHGIITVLINRIFDKPIGLAVRYFAMPFAFWVPVHVKETQPFTTSMWLRLPWRVMLGGCGIWTGTPEGLAFAAANLGWALGDVAIGSIDWNVAPLPAPDAVAS